MKKIIIILVVLLIGFYWWSSSPQKGKKINVIRNPISDVAEEKFEIPIGWFEDKTASGLMFYGPNSSYKIAVNKSDWKGNWDEVVGVKMRQISKDYLEEKTETGVKYSKKDNSEITWYRIIKDKVVWVSLTLNTNDLDTPQKKVEEIWSGL